MAAFITAGVILVMVSGFFFGKEKLEIVRAGVLDGKALTKLLEGFLGGFYAVFKAENLIVSIFYVLVNIITGISI
jgi:hypothetical protein